jgi:hypothetical protein
MSQPVPHTISVNAPAVNVPTINIGAPSAPSVSISAPQAPPTISIGAPTYDHIPTPPQSAGISLAPLRSVPVSAQPPSVSIPGPPALPGVGASPAYTVPPPPPAYASLPNYAAQPPAYYSPKPEIKSQERDCCQDDPCCNPPGPKPAPDLIQHMFLWFLTAGYVKMDSSTSPYRSCYRLIFIFIFFII